MVNSLSPDVAMPGLVLGRLALTAGFLILLFCLIVLIESAPLQLMRWGDFKCSLRASFWMNLASTLVGFLLLSLTPRLGLPGLLIAWAASVLIEWIVLLRLNPGEKRYLFHAALAANLVSYLLLILPAYLSSK